MASTAIDMPQQAACIAQAAQEAGVDQARLTREIKLRDGRRGILYGIPGGYEIGVMRIPSSVLPALVPRGITASELAWNDCTNIRIGAQMLHVRLQQQPAEAAPVTVAATPAAAPVAPQAMRMLPVDASTPAPAPPPPVAASLPASSRTQCVDSAARRFNVNPQLILAVMRTEGGTTGKVTWNKNGSYDMGLMQINSIHLPELAQLGYSRDTLINNGCANIFAGTYKLRQAIDGGQDFWHGVSRYHSKTPEKGAVYLGRVVTNLRQILANGGAMP